jgi:hypothetical protein
MALGTPPSPVGGTLMRASDGSPGGGGTLRGGGGALRDGGGTLRDGGGTLRDGGGCEGGPPGGGGIVGRKARRAIP